MKQYEPDVLTYNIATRDAGKFIHARVNGTLQHVIWQSFMKTGASKAHGIIMLRAISRCGPGMSVFECKMIWIEERSNYWLDALQCRTNKRLALVAEDYFRNAEMNDTAINYYRIKRQRLLKDERIQPDLNLRFNPTKRGW